VRSAGDIDQTEASLGHHKVEMPIPAMVMFWPAKTFQSKLTALYPAWA
jgi:hypothetical protein